MPSTDFRTIAIAALDSLGRVRALTEAESKTLEKCIRSEKQEAQRAEPVEVAEAPKPVQYGWASYPAVR